MIYYVIPAREGSKGFPLKNRKLLMNTLNIIPVNELNRLIITSDDDYIIKIAESTGIEYIKRSDELSDDKANMNDVLKDVVEKYSLLDTDIIVLLYLTYPGRTWKDVKQAISKMGQNKSLLCAEPIIDHPYLCIYQDGKKVVEHDLYRRQDYPEVRKISHYIFVCEVGELKNLNKNLYNENTVFYNIDRSVDVDSEADYNRYDMSEQTK